MTSEQPEGACHHYSECGNISPRFVSGTTGELIGYNQICDDCLDAARDAGHGRDK